MVAVVDAVLGTALGLFVSAFAQTEFQAVQFMPLIVIPQILLCGLFVPRDQLPDVLECDQRRAAAQLRRRRDADPHRRRPTTADVWRDLAVVAAYALGALALGAATLRRRTP